MNFAEQLKSQIDIVRTVGEYVRLRKIGARYVGLCPFHTEKTPSFNVNPSLGIFICFGCGMKGDVLKFVQQVEQLTFPETLKLLADRNGIPMPARRERDDPDTDLREAIFELHETAVAAFRENLFAPAASEVRQYIGKRGLTQTAVEQFSIGYSDRSGQDLIKRVKSRYTAEQLEKSGLFGTRDDGSLYDRFRGRLMFPIHNESGKVIAFGGRALRPDEEPKYLNSPETAIYKKSQCLYNLHRAKDSIRKSDRVVLVEGYMDVIGVYTAGVRHVVASCGTALTEEQVRSVKRHSTHVVVNFDPDTAGANAAERSIQKLLDEGVQVRILELEGGLDPDEYIKEKGADTYAHRLQIAPPYFTWLPIYARKKFDMTSAEGRTEGLQKLIFPALRHISNSLQRATVAGEIAGYLGLDRGTVLNEMKRTPATRGQTEPKRVPAPRLSATERVLLCSVIANPGAREILLPVLQLSAAARRFTIWPILEVIFHLVESGVELSFTTIESRLNQLMQELLSTAFFADSTEEVFSQEQAVAYVRVLDSEDRKLQVEFLRARLKEAERNGNTTEAFQLVEELNRLQRTRIT